MSIKMREEGGGENIACAGGVHFAGGIGWEALCNALLEERGTVSSVGGNQ